MSERARRRLRGAAITAAVAGLLLPGSAYGLPPEPAGREISAQAAAGFDVVILRPLGLAALVIGAASFVPVALISAPGGKDSFQAALELLVTGPANFVFQRPLGDF
jgi:hypothetical protein